MNNKQAPRLSGEIRGLGFNWTTVLIRLDAESEAYIFRNFSKRLGHAATTLMAPDWRRLLRYLATDSKGVEFDLVGVGEGSSGDELMIANVVGVDGDRPYWTASENGVIVI